MKHKDENDVKVEIFNSLPDVAGDIRITVFMNEQGFMQEFDALDDVCTHLVMFDDSLAVATYRIWLDADGYHIGRLAVIKAYRGQGLGRKMLQHAESHIRTLGGDTVSLHAQCRATAFYQMCGYAPYGDIDYDEGVEHVHMKKHLS